MRKPHDTERSWYGRNVLATLHTNSAAGALPLLTNIGIDPFLSTSAVSCAVAQKLARRLCEGCKKPAALSETMLRHLGFPYDLFEGEPVFYRLVGCEGCRGGYLGRTGVYELMPITDEVQALVLARSSADETGRAAVKGAW